MSAALFDFVDDDHASTPRTTPDAFEELAREHRVMQHALAMAMAEVLAHWSDPLIQG